MENMEIASVLKEFGDLLEIKGSNPFRIRPTETPSGPSTTSPAVRDLDLMSYGVDQAHRGWLEAGDILNTYSLEDFQAWRKRKLTA